MTTKEAAINTNAALKSSTTAMPTKTISTKSPFEVTSTIKSKLKSLPQKPILPSISPHSSALPHSSIMQLPRTIITPSSPLLKNSTTTDHHPSSASKHVQDEAAKFSQQHFELLKANNKNTDNLMKTKKESLKLKHIFLDEQIYSKSPLLKPLKHPRSSKKALQRSMSTSNPELFELHSTKNPHASKQSFTEQKLTTDGGYYLRKFSEPSKLHSKRSSTEEQSSLDLEYNKLMTNLKSDTPSHKADEGTERTVSKLDGGLEGLNKLVTMLEQLEKARRDNMYWRKKCFYFENRYRPVLIHGRSTPCKSSTSEDKVSTNKPFGNKISESNKDFDSLDLESISCGKYESYKQERKKSRKFHSKWEQVKRAFTSAKQDFVQRKEHTDSIGSRYSSLRSSQAMKSKNADLTKTDSKIVKRKKKKALVEVSAVADISKNESLSKAENESPKSIQSEPADENENIETSNKKTVFSVSSEESPKIDNKNIEALLEFSSQDPFVESTAKLKDILNFQKQQAVYFEFPDIVPFSDVMVKNNHSSVTPSSASTSDYSSKISSKSPILKSNFQQITSSQKNKKLTPNSSTTSSNQHESIDSSSSKSKVASPRNTWEKMKDIIHSRKGSLKTKKSKQEGKTEEELNGEDGKNLMQVFSERDLTKLKKTEFKEAIFSSSKKLESKSTPEIFRRKSYPAESKKEYFTRNTCKAIFNDDRSLEEHFKYSKRIYRKNISFDLGTLESFEMIQDKYDALKNSSKPTPKLSLGNASTNKQEQNNDQISKKMKVRSSFGSHVRFNSEEINVLFTEASCSTAIPGMMFSRIIIILTS